MPAPAPSVTFAIISNAPAAGALLESVCTELEAKTSVSIKPLVVRSYDKLVGGMRDGDVHVAWAPPLVAIDLERDQAAKIRLCSRRAGKADYASALFVKAAGDIRTLGDLKGKRVAWVARESSAGYVVPRLKLLAEGLDPDEIFAEQTMRRTHEAVVRVVMNGEADVGATFASFEGNAKEPISAGWLDAGYKNDEVLILAVAGPIPADVIAVSTKLEDNQADRITDAMRELGDPIRKLLNADAFDMPEQSHFDELRRLVESANRAR
ncbi:MAG: phosphate/phosphite/phosphonate ABC transporter substrate-binding protein [Polyangiaceae bacterium]|nr:phosphate/phosphite/phosphonate ABC transporter substrate-binding protein [Polyangiaceae bacterium]